MTRNRIISLISTLIAVFVGFTLDLIREKGIINWWEMLFYGVILAAIFGLTEYWLKKQQ